MAQTEIKEAESERLLLKEKLEQVLAQKSEVNPEFATFLNENKDLLMSTTPLDCDEPQIFFLGTASMKPGQYRGASAIYVLCKGIGILMDCAEGSYG